MRCFCAFVRVERRNVQRFVVRFVIVFSSLGRIAMPLGFKYNAVGDDQVVS